MIKPLAIMFQLAFFAVVAGLMGYLSSTPHYLATPADKAQIKVSFAHGAKRKVACRKLTYEEISKLPQSKRRPNNCNRQRVAVHMQLILDDKVIYDHILQPAGLSGDGPARMYEKFLVTAGSHIIVARLRDSTRDKGYDYETRRIVDLSPQQNLAIDFKADNGGFIFY